jgi:hypothetical protein
VITLITLDDQVLTRIGRPLCTVLSNVGTQPYNCGTIMNQEAAAQRCSTSAMNENLECYFT